MTDYIRPPITADADEIAEQTYARLAELVPGWEPSDGQLDVWLIQSFAALIADLGESLGLVADDIYRHFGESLLGIPPLGGSFSVVETDWTMVDDSGYVVPAGTAVAIRDAAGQTFEFRTAADVTVPAASTVASDALVVAVEEGEASSAIDTTVSGAVVLLDPLAFVQSVDGAATSRGGTDPETDDAYLDRLRDELRLMAPRPITAADFAVFARRIPGVDVGEAVSVLRQDHPAGRAVGRRAPRAPEDRRGPGGEPRERGRRLRGQHDRRRGGRDP